jgi:hypothetical protein
LAADFFAGADGVGFAAAALVAVAGVEAASLLGGAAAELARRCSLAEWVSSIFSIWRNRIPVCMGLTSILSAPMSAHSSSGNEVSRATAG